MNRDLHLKLQACLDGELPEAEGERVFRGGSWYNARRYCRCAFRDRDVPDNFDLNIGFRLLSPGSDIPAS